VIPYSDKAFRQAAIAWLVATDQVSPSVSEPQPQSTYPTPQPIQAFAHPQFKEMINMASRATNGVKIPGRKATQGEIKRMFQEHLTKLKAQLNVCGLLT
jgi:hypothetical protein